MDKNIPQIKTLERYVSAILKKVKRFLQSPVYLGKHPQSIPHSSIIFFPCLNNTIFCGLAGIVYFKQKQETESKFELPPLEHAVAHIDEHSYDLCLKNNLELKNFYLSGSRKIDELYTSVQALKNLGPFYAVFNDSHFQKRIQNLAKDLTLIIHSESDALVAHMGKLPAADVDIMSARLEKLRDIAWSLDSELLGNIVKIKSLVSNQETCVNRMSLSILKNINAALNSLDRLEVRGRDSAGISLLFVLNSDQHKSLVAQIDSLGLTDDYQNRLKEGILRNRCIRSRNFALNSISEKQFSIIFTYKIAAEIGRLGDNVQFLRQQIADDPIFQIVITLPHIYHTILAHTRWASVGDINEANCHPLDNEVLPSEGMSSSGFIHVCLNGDIDNFQSLKKAYEAEGIQIPDEITCDTKIIPIHIQAYVQKGYSIEEAFRLAVNDFEGSHAICMQTDLSPGKIYLALKGSGQSIFIGLAADHYMASSEIYGLIEDTQDYVKMDGETICQNELGNPSNGQIFVMDQSTTGGLDGILCRSYNGSSIELKESCIRKTPLTSRDIDRQQFNHYFLKEINEAPSSVRKTLENRWKIIGTGEQRYIISLDHHTLPENLAEALRKGEIKRIILIGQGTAGVAALACANILRHYLKSSSIQIESMKSSELSGFILESEESDALGDTILIPISQSGTTTDTNRTVDMAKKRGAWSIAIVNRRDSDLTFKVDGVFYTSSGRDIEMSVASTKAFYSQIIAGAILGLYFCQLRSARSEAFISNEIKQMIEIPIFMEKILALAPQIKTSAEHHAITRTYWAAVGSGSNKAAADEIRIKLSELCYKTISSDFVEDKKHIDLSSEPLIFICAAGSRRTVIGDIVKDTAIFRSHKALPIVIADEHDDGFDPYAEDVFHVPSVSEHFAPILNTLVGHLWGYYAALSINEGSKFLYDFRKDVQEMIHEYTQNNLDIHEIVFEKAFKEKILHFYNEVRRRQEKNRLSAIIGIKVAADLILLLKYLGGRLPLSDFELDFGVKGTARNMFSKLFEYLGEAINCLARPIDAIKHQAKTVTVGTSRIEEKAEGIIFDSLAENGFGLTQLTINNVLVIKNLQKIISKINGYTLYRISGINLLGEPTEETVIKVMRKSGTSSSMKSRSETDHSLKGTKKIIVQRGNVYIGMGRKDNRSILVIPIISADASKPNIIEYLMLFDIAFKDKMDLSVKIKALGGKYDHIKNLVLESNVAWKDAYLDQVETKALFGLSAEKVAEFIVAGIH